MPHKRLVQQAPLQAHNINNELIFSVFASNTRRSSRKIISNRARLASEPVFVNNYFETPEKQGFAKLAQFLQYDFPRDVDRQGSDMQKQAGTSSKRRQAKTRGRVM
jgi:hypothetical protein